MNKLGKVEAPAHDTDLRTDEIVGECQVLPQVGKPFQMFAEPLDKTLTMRLVTTSVVKEVTIVSNVYFFKTHNSVYTLKILG